MRETRSIPAHASASSRGSDESTKVNHIDRVLRTLRAGHRAVVDARNEDALLRDVCRVVVEEGGYLMAWVGYAEHDEQKSIRPMAYAGHEDGLFAVSRFSWADDERGHTAAGTAIRSGRPSIGRKLRSDPALAPWREEAVKRGYGVSSAFPLCSDDEVFGCLVIIAAETSPWDEGDAEWLSELSEGLAYGINHLRMQKRHVEAERVIEHMAHFDELTGLPNRKTLAAHLAGAITTAREKHYPLSMLSIAVGHYNEISDTLGHRTGDRFLVEIVGRISANRRSEEEMLARVGEDEFALLLSPAGADRATTVAQRIITALYERQPFDGRYDWMLRTQPTGTVGDSFRIYEPRP